MRSESSLFGYAATAITAFALIASIFFSADFALAGDKKQTAAALAPRPPAAAPHIAELVTAPLPDPRLALDESDEIAALESVQLALSEVADGSTYVWHRANGRLSGVVQPTASFKDAAGNVCRHIVVSLTSGMASKKTEGIACRLSNGLWQLDG